LWFFSFSLFVMAQKLFNRIIQALHHPYFFALPYPTHPSKLPKAKNAPSSRPLPLEELDVNSPAFSPKPAVLAKKDGETNRSKRKASGTEGIGEGRNVARRLDFTGS
jgi:cyclin-dependent kinase 7